jgi:hypothetical protein
MEAAAAAAATQTWRSVVWAVIRGGVVVQRQSLVPTAYGTNSLNSMHCC